ncbi:MAG: Queuine tRNA-ribosyltransferase [Parcubacteria group bacterium ADurb.Bin326]|nr:MAG: Queuine tRNA-ribosyltransferase [Parcubacteria group bacterium ADurb.Bin326]
MFKLIKKSKKSQARLGILKTAHGTLKTPFFMPIATKAAVKNLTTDEIRELKSPIILSNTYHLYLTPGMEVMKKAGGLHKFMDWRGAILTDSGGFQVFSLSKIRKILPQGVEFRSHLDGSKHLLTPKKVLEIQKTIGSDIAMILDVCPPSTASHKEVAEAVSMTTKWGKEAKRVIKLKEFSNSKQLRFAIVQGGIFEDLRLKSLKDLAELDFDGYAVGGLAVGETNQEMYQVLDYLAPQMPDNKPRYLMGVGTPENIVEAVKRGVDMFDCVIPTREARHGRLYLQVKSGFGKGFYETINITNAKYKNDFSSINNSNLKKYSKAYLHHLFKTGEPLGMRLATLNNIEFYLKLMDDIRKYIKRGAF